MPGLFIGNVFGSSSLSGIPLWFLSMNMPHNPTMVISTDGTNIWSIIKNTLIDKLIRFRGYIPLKSSIAHYWATTNIIGTSMTRTNALVANTPVGRMPAIRMDLYDRLMRLIIASLSITPPCLYDFNRILKYFSYIN